jgi:hypothetical protein
MICPSIKAHCGEPLEKTELCSQPPPGYVADFIELEDSEEISSDEKDLYYENLSYGRVFFFVGPPGVICNCN